MDHSQGNRTPARDTGKMPSNSTVNGAGQLANGPHRQTVQNKSREYSDPTE
jgi:hypothetical protein